MGILRTNTVVPILVIAVASLHAAPPSGPSGWRAKVDQAMPFLGHRNWILVVDSAYPLQVSPGVETIDTNSGETEVLPYVLHAIDRSIQVRPDIYMDPELPFVPDQDAPGASAYRADIAGLLRGYQVQSLPHERLIATVDEAGKTFHVLVLKTNLTVPYSSVFIRLNCKYWSDDAETRLRQRWPQNSSETSQSSVHSSCASMVAHCFSHRWPLLTAALRRSTPFSAV